MKAARDSAPILEWKTPCLFEAIVLTVLAGQQGIGGAGRRQGWEHFVEMRRQAADQPGQQHRHPGGHGAERSAGRAAPPVQAENDGGEEADGVQAAREDGQFDDARRRVQGQGGRDGGEADDAHARPSSGRLLGLVVLMMSL